MDKYFLGLDIGTNSCGWAVTDTNYKLCRKKGKDLWGVRLFETAETAQNRRMKRTSRRRLFRKRLQLSWLRDVFSNELNKVDNKFLTRLKYSSLLYEEGDKAIYGLNEKESLFSGTLNGKKFTDKDYYKTYPTIYHLRKELTQKPADDVRLLYLALHNIIKHRGHFLYEKDFGNSANILEAINDVIKNITDLYSTELENSNFNLLPITQETCEKIKEYLKNKRGIKDTKNKFIELFNAKTKCEKSFCNVLVDGKVNLNDLFTLSNEAVKIDFNSETIDEELLSLSNSLTEEQLTILNQIREVYSSLQLSAILGDSNYVCEAMVNNYEVHNKQLKELKLFIKQYYPKKYFDLFRNHKNKNVGYSQYVNGDLVAGKKQVANLVCGNRDKDLFYKYVKSILNEEPTNVTNQQDYESKKQNILSLIENNQFLLKQRVKTNGLFPNSIYVKELKQILKVNQEKYTFLNEKDSTGLTNSDKILQILTFKVPYFVGPIGKSEEGQNFGWVTKECDLKYYPWTLKKLVDFDKAEDNFIQKMTNKCTYLPTCDVLPKRSIIYSKYCVLNELNKLKLNGNEISVDLKQRIFNNLFTNKNKVTINDLKRFLVAENEFTADEVKTLSISGIDKEFKNNFASYSNLINNSNGLFTKEFVDNNLETFEKIIKYHTIISDKNRLVKRIEKEFGNLFTSQQINKLKSYNYEGWGNLSKDFLLDLQFINKQTGEVTCVLKELWDTNQNLQQVLNNSDYTLSENLYKNNTKQLDSLTYDDVQALYCSPAVKRGVWQCLKVVKEVISVMGNTMPEKIFVEVTRDDEVKGDKGRKLSRLTNLKSYYSSKEFKNNVYVTNSELNKLMEELNKRQDNDLRSEKLYLYFLQMGKCMYSGKPININDINNLSVCDVDHIIPQALIKDDSINNKVLVLSEYNRVKLDSYPIYSKFPEWVEKQKDFWGFLLSKNLITKEKYDRLIRKDELNNDEYGQFIARQLVETNQSAKAVIDFLKQCVDNPRKIVYSKAGFVSDFRKEFDIFKSRTVNDLHHAKDAYLNIVVGNVLNSRFTDDPRHFYSQENINNKMTKNVKKLFENIVYSPLTKLPVWNKEKDLAEVKKTCSKNSCLISKMSYAKTNDNFYKETIHKSKRNNPKTEASIPLKGNGTNPLSNYEKYGGYNNYTYAYFMVVESLDKKGRKIKTIEAIPTIIVKNNSNKPDYNEILLDYLTNNCKLNKPKILVPKINIQSTLKIGNGEYWLGGKTGDGYVLHNANQWFANDEIVKYVKIIEKYNLIKLNKTEESLTQTDSEIIVSKASKLGNTELVLTKQKNIWLYEEIINLLSKNVYSTTSLSTVVKEKLITCKDLFSTLSVQDQCDVLSSVLKRISTGCTLCDLSKLKEGSSVGLLKLGKNITDKKIILVEKSATGIFEKEIIL